MGHQVKLADSLVEIAMRDAEREHRTLPKQIEPKPGEAIGQLYNLSEDLHEEHDLYAKYPEKVKELTDMLEKIKQAKQRTEN